MSILTPPWSFRFGFLNLNERNFEFSGMKKDDRKLPNENGKHSDWVVKSRVFFFFRS